MIVLDENILEDQRQLLRLRRIRVRQIGHDLWRKGLQDDEIPRLLKQLRRPTFFTRDLGFYDQRFCGDAYGVMVLGVGQREVASYVPRILRHPDFANQAQRMGSVVFVAHRSIRVWKRNAECEGIYPWQK